MNRDDKPNQTWVFDRYVNGVLMAEGVEVTRASSIEKAMATAAKLAARGPNGETPVLVSRTALDALTRLEDAEAAQRRMQGEGATGLFNNLSPEQQAAALAFKGNPDFGPADPVRLDPTGEERQRMRFEAAKALVVERAERDALKADRDRLLALAPHLWPSVSHRAEWERLLRDVNAEVNGRNV